VYRASWMGTARSWLIVLVLRSNRAQGPVDVPVGRLEERRELQKLIDHQSHLLDHSAAARGLDEYYDKALAMLNSSRLRRATCRCCGKVRRASSVAATT